jgi:peptidoglycan-associated lipoprotein
MRFETSRFAGLAAILVLTMAIAACSSPKKPPPPVTATPQTTAPSAPSQPVPQAQPPRSTQLPPPPSQGVVPGSVQDFVATSGGDRVFFEYDSFAIRPDATPILDAQAAWLARYPQVSVRIEGNADERGTREYNFALGARRANSVRDHLVRRGVAASRIETVSYGKERPIDGGADEAAFARNRNAHTALTGGGGAVTQGGCHDFEA